MSRTAKNLWKSWLRHDRMAANAALPARRRAAADSAEYGSTWTRTGELHEMQRLVAASRLYWRLESDYNYHCLGFGDQITYRFLDKAQKTSPECRTSAQNEVIERWESHSNEGDRLLERLADAKSRFWDEPRYWDHLCQS